jgi:hypothetical protein
MRFEAQLLAAAVRYAFVAGGFRTLRATDEGALIRDVIDAPVREFGFAQGCRPQGRVAGLLSGSQRVCLQFLLGYHPH